MLSVFVFCYSAAQLFINLLYQFIYLFHYLLFHLHTYRLELDGELNRKLNSLFCFPGGTFDFSYILKL